MNPSFKRLLWAIPFVLAAILLYFALRNVEWHRVGDIVAGARIPLLFAGVIWATGAYLLRALRWQVLLRAAEPVTLGLVFWAMVAGYLGNNFLPGRAGEVIRSLLISSHSKLTRSYVLTTAFVERASDLIFLVTAASIVLVILPQRPEWLGRAAGAMAAAGFLAAIALAFIPRTERLLQRILTILPIPERFRGKLLEIAVQVRLGVASLHHPSRAFQFVSLTFLIWTSDVLGVMLLSYALHLSLAFSAGLLFITALGLSSALPSTPGYVGVFQFVAVSVLVPFGFSSSDAIALILVMQALGYVVVGSLGMISIWRFGLTRKQFAG